MRRGHQRAVDLFVQATRGQGLTHQQFTLLQAVAAGQGLSQTALVHMTGIDRSTLTDMIGRLVDRGVLKRSRAEDDRRANLIVLTEKGRQLLNQTTPAALEADRAFLEPIPPERREELIALLQRLADVDGDGGADGLDGAASGLNGAAQGTSTAVPA
ncbi:MarR family winged helix-turn-helix transcriptional regulator [Zavarzinia sp. CC-PAN008]|uniref:MarR family winged helix-turn-helix transcriptional regulator n=1 Tax=Zavarzinia sp. CC-PAN008 TaxID=3243332 RepID=UPI003F745896